MEHSDSSHVTERVEIKNITHILGLYSERGLNLSSNMYTIDESLGQDGIIRFFPKYVLNHPDGTEDYVSTR